MRLIFALLLSSLATALVLAREAPDAGPWVVRAEFDTQAQLWLATREFAPWERRGEVLVLELPDRYAWDRLRSFGLRFEIDEALTALLRAPPLRGTGPGIPGYPCYRTVDETYATAQALALAHPERVDWIAIGDSWERLNVPGAGDPIMLLRIRPAHGQPRPALFAIAAIHARELTTAELLTRFAETLLAEYGVDPDSTWMLDEHELHLVLQANPDGRRQAQQGLLWRKNTNRGYCGPTSNNRGADLNRNWPFGWGGAGASTAQCNQTFRGSGPASEPETQALRDYVRALFPAARPPDFQTAAPADTPGLFLDIHSFSELVLWPWGEFNTPAPNGLALERLGRRLAWYNGYEPKQSVALYPTSGTTIDFAYGERGVAAFTYELGRAFFESCAVFENEVLPANLASLRHALRVTRAPYLLADGPDVDAIQLSSTRLEPGDPLRVEAVADAERYSLRNGGTPRPAPASARLALGDVPWRAGAWLYPMVASASATGGRLPVAAELSVPALAPGRQLLFVEASDGDGAQGPPYAAFIEIAAPASTARIDGLLRGSAGQGLAGRVEGGGSQAHSEATGAFLLRLWPGSAQIEASAPGHRSRRFGLGPLAAGEQRQLVIVLHPDCSGPSCDGLFIDGFETPAP